ncbi:MAG: hypothetical protein M3Q32_14580 [Pseudomonadota bacterium]|nr:hypothetical protein [Pseudomonadota bacterium]
MAEAKIDLESLRARLTEKELTRTKISEDLLDPNHSKEEVKSLLDRGTSLDVEIEALENRIRAIEFPESDSGQPINPWDSNQFGK